MRTDAHRDSNGVCRSIALASVVIGKQSADWDRAEAVDVASAVLQQHPDIDLFYGNSDEMGIGACIAAKKIGRTVNKDVWCISIDGNPVTLDLIEKGDTTATLGVYPRLIAVTVIQQMNKFLRERKYRSSWRLRRLL